MRVLLSHPCALPVSEIGNFLKSPRILLSLATMQKAKRPATQYDTHKPKELRRLYEPLSVLHKLSTKGATKPRSLFSTSSRAISITQRRRNFVDAIACLGAYEKECKIAAAVEQLPDGLVVRVAGTGDIDGIVVPFLNELLSLLSATLRLQTGEITDHEKEIASGVLLDAALEFAPKKLYAHYMKLLHRIAPVCFADMEIGQNGM